MKTLITHINPHLDDIVGIWFLRRFDPNFANANLEFISASREAASKDESDDRVYVGTGGGKYDEHKEELKDECATTLVFKDLKAKNLISQDEIVQKALEDIANWSLLIDTGHFPTHSLDEFDVQAFIRPQDNSAEASKKSVELGEEILDRILEVLKTKHQAIQDWKKRVEFKSGFGESYAIESESVNREFCRKAGGDLFIMINPKYKSVQFFTPSFEIDLESLYDKLKELDPEASWFLHQSHHMILCGAGAAPDFTPTKLSMQQLIEATN